LAPFPPAIRQRPIHWSPRGVCAILPVMFGSIVEYGAYLYAPERLPMAIAPV
jgi:hypothetical protein